MAASCTAPDAPSGPQRSIALVRVSLRILRNWFTQTHASQEISNASIGGEKQKSAHDRKLSHLGRRLPVVGWPKWGVFLMGLLESVSAASVFVGLLFEARG